MHAASPWREGALIEEVTHEYDFGSVNAAICAYAAYRQRDHSDGSALGAQLERMRLQLGATDAHSRTDHDPRSAHRVLRRVDLVRAFDGICYGELAAPIPRELAIAIVLVRCPGVHRGGPPPTYTELCEQLLTIDYAVTPRQLKRVNRLARRELIVELVARGLLRQPPGLDATMQEAIEARTAELDARGAAA